MSSKLLPATPDLQWWYLTCCDNNCVTWEDLLHPIGQVRQQLSGWHRSFCKQLSVNLIHKLKDNWILSNTIFIFCTSKCTYKICNTNWRQEMHVKELSLQNIYITIGNISQIKSIWFSTQGQKQLGRNFKTRIQFWGSFPSSCRKVALIFNTLLLDQKRVGQLVLPPVTLWDIACLPTTFPIQLQGGILQYNHKNNNIYLYL